jgi:hypothetical protein
MANRRTYTVGFYALLVCALAWLHFDVPGCNRRSFPPVRDAEAYVLEVYRVEVPGDAGRGHPDIESVMSGRHVRLLDRYPPLHLNVGDITRMECEASGYSVRIQAEFKALQREFATLVLDVQPWERASSRLRIPLDTWGAAMTDVNMEQGALSLLIFRLNRPEV